MPDRVVKKGMQKCVKIQHGEDCTMLCRLQVVRCAGCNDVHVFLI